MSSNLVQYAEDELSRIGMGADSRKENKMMHDHIIHMVEEFSKEGHSGFSASYALSILKKLLNWEPLTPLTGEPEEWNVVSEASGEPMWQNKRCSRVFKDDTGRAYDIEGKVFTRKGEGGAFTNSDSHVEVAFPYTPKTEYVELDESDE